MRFTFCTIALAVALLTGSCALLGPRGPGHGYRLERNADKAKGYDLYFGEKRLGSAGQYSVSPSGRYAMFDDTGKLRLFDSNSGAIRDVTDGTFAVPWTFAWDEAAGVVDVTYYQSHDPSKISLRR